MINAEDLKAAKSWYNSLPGGKKKYYKEHCKLNDPRRLVRFWLNSIKTGVLK